MSDTGSVSIKASATVFENVNKALQARIAELEAERDRWKAAAEQYDLIRQESVGVVGYHRNGDIAEWGEFDVDALTAIARGEK